MPILQRQRSCATCGAVVVLQVSQGDGEPFEGIDNEQAHAQWHEELRKQLLNARLQLPMDAATI